MAGENKLNVVYIIKEICFMKRNTFYEDQCCTSCFDIEGPKLLNAPRIWLCVSIPLKKLILPVDDSRSRLFSSQFS